nr:hypothetical protein [Tanacetum cinerariifolium]
MPALEDVGTFDFSNEDEADDAVADMSNLDITIQVSHIPTTRIHKDHPLDQVTRDLHSTTQTKNMSKDLEEHGFVSTIQQRSNHKDLQNCFIACFLSKEEPKKVIHALKDPNWIEAMQEELLQFNLQKRFEDPDFLDRVYKVEKALYGLHQAPRACQDKYVAEILKKFGFIDVKNASTPIETQKPLLKNEDEVKNANTPIETQKPLLKNEDGEEVDVHIYRYLKGQPKMGIWYPKDYPFDLVAYIDSDYVGASLDKRVYGKKVIISEASIRRDLQFADEEEVDCLPNSTIFEQLASMGVDGKKVITSEASIRRDLQFADEEEVDCLPNSTIFEQLPSMGHVASAIICLATNQKFNF